MTMSAPSLDHLWILDRRKELAAGLRENIAHRYAMDAGSIILHQEAVDASEALGKNVDLPGMALTDQVGLLDFRPGVSFANVLRDACPLSVIVLYSEGAYGDPSRIDSWLEERKIDFAVRKGDIEKLHGVLDQVRRISESVAARNLRDYISSQPDPPAPFYRVKKGSYLTIADLYREILRNTPLGQQTAKAWDQQELVAQNH